MDLKICKKTYTLDYVFLFFVISISVLQSLNKSNNVKKFNKRYIFRAESAGAASDWSSNIAAAVR
jgi:hypothetical protein